MSDARRVALYAATTAAIAYILACGIILHGIDLRDRYRQARGPRPAWRLAWR